MSDEETIAFYQREAPAYTLSSAQGPSAPLDTFLDRLCPGAHVLELGCGGGRDAAHMVRRGFLVDPTDGTPAMARKAQERFDLPARIMRFDQLDMVERYDAVWAHAALLHCPRDNLCEIIGKIHAALKPGGWHFANFKTGQGEARDSLGRYYNYPDQIWLLDCYRRSGNWAEIIEQTGIGKGYDGEQARWIALSIRKA